MMGGQFKVHDRGTPHTGMSRNIYPLAAVQVVLQLLFCHSFQLWQQIM